VQKVTEEARREGGERAVKEGRTMMRIMRTHDLV